MHVFALSGSLRAASINTALLRAVRRVAPPGIRVELFDELAALPLFNPDLEACPPAAVIALRQRVAAADALLIASPEYAHGIAGGLKNALDWLVSFPPFAHKPVALLNASARAQHADAALRETLRTMSANLLDTSALPLALPSDPAAAAMTLHSPAMAETLARMLALVQTQLRARPAPAAAP